MTRVLIADDHPFLCEGVKAVLTAAGMDVVESVADGDAALAAIARHQPDVIILDINMPVRDGISTLQEMRRQGDRRPVVVLTANIGDARLLTAMEVGVNAVVCKQGGSTRLAEVINTVCQGGQSIPPELIARAGEAAGDGGGLAARLSPREREIVMAVAEGLRNREIAEARGISEGAIKVSLFRIYEKLGVRSRSELILRLREIGILPD